MRITEKIEYDIGIDSFVYGRSYDVKVPISFGIRINNICNFNCSYCLSDSHRNSLQSESTSRIKEIIEAWSPARIVFCGGEPMLDDMLCQYLQYSRDMGSINIVATNGTIFPDQRTLGLVDWWDICLHGHNKDSHRTITGFNSFNEVISNVKRLVALNERVGCNIVLTKSNIDQMSDIINKITNIGVKKLRFSSILLLGRAKGMSGDVPSSNKILNFNNNIRAMNFPILLILPQPNGAKLMSEGYFVINRKGIIESPVLLRGKSFSEASESDEYKQCLEKHLNVFRNYKLDDPAFI